MDSYVDCNVFVILEMLDVRFLVELVVDMESVPDVSSGVRLPASVLPQAQGLQDCGPRGLRQSFSRLEPCHGH